MTKELLQQIEEKEPEFIDLSPEGLGPWSISKLKVLQQCGLNFYLKYIVKLKGLPQEPSLVTEVGKAAHLILEQVIMGKPITDSFILIRKSFVKTINDEDWKDYVLSLELNIMEFRTKLDTFERTNPVKRYVQEMRIGVDKDFNSTGFFDKDVYFRGIIDLGIQTESGDVIVIDHKTGAPPEMGIRNFKVQLDTYKVLFHHGVDKVNGAQSGIHFIKAGQIQLDDYVDKEVIEGKLKNEIQFYIEGAIDKNIDNGFFKHVRGSYCKWCDFNESCKAGLLTDVEKGTKKFFPIKEVK